MSILKDTAVVKSLYITIIILFIDTELKDLSGTDTDIGTLCWYIIIIIIVGVHN